MADGDVRCSAITDKVKVVSTLFALSFLVHISLWGQINNFYEIGTSKLAGSP